MLRHVRQVTEAIICRLFHTMMKWPNTAAKRAEIGRKFYRLKKVNMPLVCGAVDGTLIRIKAPTENEHQFVDRHNNHSVSTYSCSYFDNFIRSIKVSARWKWYFATIAFKLLFTNIIAEILFRLMPLLLLNLICSFCMHRWNGPVQWVMSECCDRAPVGPCSKCNNGVRSLAPSFWATASTR